MGTFGVVVDVEVVVVVSFSPLAEISQSRPAQPPLHLHTYVLVPLS